MSIVPSSTNPPKSPPVPSFHNDFGVCFRPTDKCNLRSWDLSPYYVPPKEQDLISKCMQTYTTRCKQNTRDSSETIFYRYPDPFISRCLDLLDLKELANFSQVSQCCYLATKSDSMWKVQFQKLFPNIEFLQKEKSCFSTEQQFKIYFHRMNTAIEPYKKKLQKNNNSIMFLIGPHGNDGEIEKMRKKYLDYIEGKALNDTCNRGSNAFLAHKKFEELKRRLESLVGTNYDGTPDSIAKDSQQDRCLEAINRFIPGEFNNQQRFIACIQNAEKEIGNKI